MFLETPWLAGNIWAQDSDAPNFFLVTLTWGAGWLSWLLEDRGSPRGFPSNEPLDCVWVLLEGTSVGLGCTAALGAPYFPTLIPEGPWGGGGGERSMGTRRTSRFFSCKDQGALSLLTTADLMLKLGALRGTIHPPASSAGERSKVRAESEN